MQARNTMSRWLLGAALALSSALALAANVAAPSGSAGPLSWSSTGTPPVISEKAALDAARQLLTLDSGASGTPTAQHVQVVDYTAATPGHGGVRTIYTAWLISAPGVALRNANSDETATLTLSALIQDASAPKLYAVFDARNDSAWVPVYAGFKPRAAADEMEADRWQVDAEPLAVTPKIGMAQLLSDFWSRSGISPAGAGQFVLLARQAAPQLPARRVQGKQVALYFPGSYWVMQISGSHAHDLRLPQSAKPGSSVPYMSGVASLMTAGGKLLRSVYLP